MNRKEFREGLKELLTYYEDGLEDNLHKTLEKLGFDFSKNSPDRAAYDKIGREFYEEGWDDGLEDGYENGRESRQGYD